MKAAFIVLAFSALAGGVAVADPPSPAPSAAPSKPPAPAGSAPASTNEVPALIVRGQVLTIAKGFFIFTTGDSVRTAPELVVPAGVTTGSYVRVAIDQLTRQVVAIELEPRVAIPGEIDVAKLPREYVVVSPKSAPLPAPSNAGSGGDASQVTVTIVVHVPSNTPTSDDVYLSTNRSNFSPAEVRMDRIDATTFSTSVALANGSSIKYEFTRGSYTTVERDRSGGEVAAHSLVAAPNEKTQDTVARWADLS